MSRYLSVSEFLAMFPLDSVLQALGTVRDATGHVVQADPATLEARVGAFIEQAEDEADMYIGTQYVLPLLSVPPAIKPFIADLARWRVYSAKPDDAVRDRHNAAISFFNKVARGDILLGVPNQDTTVAANNNLPSVSTRKAWRPSSGALANWREGFDVGSFM